jgi:hypothetical protein
MKTRRVMAAKIFPNIDRSAITCGPVLNPGAHFRSELEVAHA